MTTSQRLKELLWRDLEQGCTWAHLSSVTVAAEGGTDGAVGGMGDRAAQDNSHWAARRSHVFGVVALLAEPLRVHATAIREGRAAYGSVRSSGRFSVWWGR